jgi:hypothetical protein
MEKVLLVIVVAVIVTVLVVMLVKKFKKKPTPTPTPKPSPRPPEYLHFLDNVETVIRNNLSEEELATYFASVKSQFEQYQYESGFMSKWTALLAKYNIPHPY